MSYNDAGAVTSLTYPDGETLSSNYDSKGFLRSLYFGTSSSSDPVAFLAGQVSYTNTGQLAGLSIGGSGAKTSVPTHGNAGWKYQIPSYTHPPVTIDITPVSFYLPPSVSQPYTPPVVAPTPDPSWWSQAISWATDTFDQFTSWVSDTWEEDSPVVEEGLSWVADTFGWLA